MNFSVIILFLVFILIAVRQIGRVRLSIWQIMLFGALAVLILGQISVNDAVSSVNLDVMLFLFGMFVVGVALEQSGYLEHLSYNLLRGARSVDSLILLILLLMGVASAFLLNDTLAIIGTPVALALARHHKISYKLLLLTLCFAVTIGSAASPIGNPQNLLIAVNSNIQNPFILFFSYLLIPTLINIFIAYILLKLFYAKEFHNGRILHKKQAIKDRRLANISKVSLILILFLVMLKVLFVFLDINFDFRLTYIAILACLPVLAFSARRIEIIKKVDWHTLIFFASMFVLMQSVWNSGFFQGIFTNLKLDITSILVILIVSVLLSQLISNVPLVALYLPSLIAAGGSSKGFLALAAGSTIAGNLFILGAASNVIIIQNAEKKIGDSISFLEFAKIGVPLTIINVLVYYVFLVWI